MPRYRTLNNDLAVNVDGVRVFADIEGWFDAAPGSRLEEVLLNGGAVSDSPGGSGSGPAYLGSVADEAAMLALSAAVGDTAYRTDAGVEYRCIALPASSAANWRANGISGVMVDIGTPVGVEF